MTAPRIITADEARVLREAATPGPWRVTDYDTVAPSIGCGGWDIAVVHGDDDGRPWDADDSEPVAPLPLSDAALIAAAPDLAATVEALHAEVARLTALVEDQRWDARDDVRMAGLCERSRIAAWLRRKAMAGITAGLPETPTLLALLSYADAIAKNHTED